MSTLAVALFLVNAVCPLDLLVRRDGIHEAARVGNVFHVQLILAAHPERVNEPNSWGKGYYPSPVHLAAERNQVAVLKVLIAHGGDVNARGEAGDTPLHYAILWGASETPELLLKHGAFLDMYSAVALNKCEEVKGYLQLAEVFGLSKWLANLPWPESSWHETPLLRVAIEKGHPEMVRLLLAHGASPITQAVRRHCFISDTNFKGITVGLTLAGTFTGDFDLPAQKP